MAWKSSTRSGSNRWAPPDDILTPGRLAMNLKYLLPTPRMTAAATALMAFCIGATTTPASAQASKIEKPNITFGVFPITNYGVVYLSLQQGFFQDEGLNVTPRVMGANPIAGIVGGDFDTG